MPRRNQSNHPAFPRSVLVLLAGSATLPPGTPARDRRPGNTGDGCREALLPFFEESLRKPVVTVGPGCAAGLRLPV